MSFLRPETLHVQPPGSPGSSVFDLPAQQGGSARLSPLPRESVQTEVRGQVAPIDDDTTMSCVVISGGTGGNGICAAFGVEGRYVLPVSDDGGSSSEIIRVLGGPSIGDIRSRLVRLIPVAAAGSPLDAIRKLLAHRLPCRCSEQEAREQWREIVEGRSELWKGIPSDRKETIRGFLVYFESQVLKRAHKNFSFLNGSIGNYFLAAAQGFFRSLPSAIFLFSSITHSQATILPVIVTNHTVTIAAELENGEKLVGQCEISHPVQSPPPITLTTSPRSPVDGMDQATTLNHQNNVMFDQQDKDHYIPLPEPIHRLYYINAYGHEVHPAPNPDFLASLAESNVLVYSCGSLWTRHILFPFHRRSLSPYFLSSIIPCLAVRGIATAIAASKSLRIKVLLLNASNDRETHGYSAADYIRAIVRTLNARYHAPPLGLGSGQTIYPPSAFLTDLVYLQGTHVPVDVQEITAMGVRCTQVAVQGEDDGSPPQFDAITVRNTIKDLLATNTEGL